MWHLYGSIWCWYSSEYREPSQARVLFSDVADVHKLQLYRNFVKKSKWTLRRIWFVGWWNFCERAALVNQLNSVVSCLLCLLNEMGGQTRKSVLILDRCSFFCRSSGVTFNVKVAKNDEQVGELDNETGIGMKSLWSCIVECVLEYCRILFDIFEEETLVNDCCGIIVNCLSLQLRLLVVGIDQRDQFSCWNRYKNLCQVEELLDWWKSIVFFLGGWISFECWSSERRCSISGRRSVETFVEVVDQCLVHPIKQASCSHWWWLYKHWRNRCFFQFGRVMKKVWPLWFEFVFVRKRVQNIEEDIRMFVESHNEMALEMTEWVEESWHIEWRGEGTATIAHRAMSGERSDANWEQVQIKDRLCQQWKFEWYFHLCDLVLFRWQNAN